MCPDRGQIRTLKEYERLRAQYGETDQPLNVAPSQGNQGDLGQIA